MCVLAWFWVLVWLSRAEFFNGDRHSLNENAAQVHVMQFMCTFLNIHVIPCTANVAHTPQPV